jgi:endoglucanase
MIIRRAAEKLVGIIFLLLIFFSCQSQEKTSIKIRVNQIGFYPNAPKVAVVTSGSDASDFYVTTIEGKKVYQGKLSEIKRSSYSPKTTRVADFSSFTTPGVYKVTLADNTASYPFEIKNNVHEEIAKGVIKGFYFQRFSTQLNEAYAGKWQRKRSSVNDNVIIHPSAETAKRPSGTMITSPRGWIDAGDYNKYIVNSGIATGTLLSAYEDFPFYFDTLKLDIPENKNTIPDLLDETLWNLRWMLTMQDPDDGGVYHKCTNANFDKMVMPDQATTPRYMVQKGTGAALNFAAVMAQSARVFQKFNQQLPSFADSCLRASKLAWTWAIKNPSVAYDQNEINKKFDPDITTGEYGDRYFSDEFIWAAAELYVTTKDEGYVKSINFLPDAAMPIPSWSQVRLLGYYTLLRQADKLPVSIQPTVQEIKKRLISLADEMIRNINDRSYQTLMGASSKDFIWGSNSVAANQSIVLIQAYKASNDTKYLPFALTNLDYLLGRNATGYSYVTGYGDKTPMHIHHRPSEGDGVEEPVPGLLAGGPNPGMQDKCSYASAIPDEAYSDNACSYASNEIAINWNAPLVYLVCAMESLQSKLTSGK